MKILFVCKRHPQQRDLIKRPYGRFHHLPRLLAARGHDVRALLCSHRGLPGTQVSMAGVAWTGLDVRTLGIHGFLRALEQQVRSDVPDWIVGCSDAWYGWLAQRLARKSGARLLVDAYDNYEAYMPWNLPLHWAWRRAVRVADIVTAAGPQLAGLLDRQRRGRRPALIVPMAADPMFVPRGRSEARAMLDLPPGAPLVGYSGSWAQNRGTDVLLEAFRRVRSQRGDARLVLTGKPPPHALAEPGVIALGYVEDARLPFVLSALDVACVITADTAFGRFSYPAKLCEAMACQVQVVATLTEPVRWMLQDDMRFLAPIGDAGMIAERILERLDAGRASYPTITDWGDSALRLESALTAP